MTQQAQEFIIPTEEQTKVAVTQSCELKSHALAIVVTDEVTLGSAGEFDKRLREADKKAEEYFKPLKKAFDDGKAVVLQKEKEVRGPIAEAREIVRKVMSDFLTEQERKRKAEEARLRAEAEEKARKEQEALLAKAAKAEDKGQHDKAQDLLEKAEDVYAAPIETTQATPVRTDSATTSGRKDIVVDVTNLKQFIMALAEADSNAFDALFKVQPSALKAWAKSNGIKNFKGLSIREIVVASVR